MDTGANIPRAIARSRTARRAHNSRRRRLALAACASALVSVPLSFSLLGVTGNDLVHAAVSGANSLSDFLSRRSPGARTTAQLTKTKHSRSLPKQRIAPRVAPLIRKPDFGEVAGLVIGSPTVDIAPPPPIVAIDIPALPGLIVGSGPGGETPPGGGGGGGGVVTVPTSEPHSPIPVSPLPEPGTWATMLLGFGLLGWRVRRGTKQRAKIATRRISF
ncbi:MAG TPA: PEP-CTERM sorting domain-containing protein [Sphingomicrobium sp.]